MSGLTICGVSLLIHEIWLCHPFACSYCMLYYGIMSCHLYMHTSNHNGSLIVIIWYRHLATSTGLLARVKFIKSYVSNLVSWWLNPMKGHKCVTTFNSMWPWAWIREVTWRRGFNLDIVKQLIYRMDGLKERATEDGAVVWKKSGQFGN